MQLVNLLHKRGQIDELQQLTKVGYRYATVQLADLMHKRGQSDEAIVMLRKRVDAGGSYAAGQLAHLMHECGQGDEAIAMLRQHADVGYGYAAPLVQLLHTRGRSTKQSSYCGSMPTWATPTTGGPQGT